MIELIIGYDFFGLAEGGIFDTPICTDMIDNIDLSGGYFDELFIDLDIAKATESIAKTETLVWDYTTILQAKFNGNLDGGSIVNNGFKIDKILLQRSLVGSDLWDVVAVFDYKDGFDSYRYTDRYIQNGAVYQYAIVPVSSEVIGARLISGRILCSYEGMFLTDREENRRVLYDIELGDITYNKESAVVKPLNSSYPVATFSKGNYRTGNISTLPLSDETIMHAGSQIDGLAEQVNRDKWSNFIHNGRAKVIRMDSGVLMLAITTNLNVSHKQEGSLRDLASISFDYTEIGAVNFDNLLENGLISEVFASSLTYDDFGGVMIGK